MSNDWNCCGDTEALRGRLRWLINDTMQLDSTINYQDIKQYISSFAYEGLIPGTGRDTMLPVQRGEFEDRKDYGDWAGSVNGKIKDISAH